jgi:hypothetical protein
MQEIAGDKFSVARSEEEWDKALNGNVIKGNNSQMLKIAKGLRKVT